MRFLLLFFPIIFFADDSFITQLEYGRMLYENPRGIGCLECHGDSGEGKIIARYMHKQKQKELLGPKINNLDFKTFASALQKSKKVMPKYYLTQQEIEAIYQYLESKKETTNSR